MYEIRQPLPFPLDQLPAEYPTYNEIVRGLIDQIVYMYYKKDHPRTYTLIDLVATFTISVDDLCDIFTRLNKKLSGIRNELNARRILDDQWICYEMLQGYISYEVEYAYNADERMLMD